MCNFKPGDKFIRKSPRGTVIIGEVDRIIETFVIDEINNVIYIQFKIVTTNGVSYITDGSDGIINKISIEHFNDKVIKLIDYIKQKNNEKNDILSISKNNPNV